MGFEFRRKVRGETMRRNDVCESVRDGWKLSHVYILTYILLIYSHLCFKTNMYTHACIVSLCVSTYKIHAVSFYFIIQQAPSQR